MNDITPPKKTLSEAVAQADQVPTSSADNVMPKRRRWPKALLGILALIMVIGGYVGWQSWQRRDLWADIAGIKITKEQFSATKKSVESAAAAAGTKPADANAEARDILVLNAGLRLEAKKANQSFSQNDIEDYIKLTAGEYGDLSNYYASMLKKYGWSKEDVLLRRTNDYLQEKLYSREIAQRDYSMVYIRWDRIRGYNADKEDPTKERAALEKLTSKYLPLFEQKKSSEELAKSVDVLSGMTDDELANVMERELGLESLYSKISTEALAKDSPFKAYPGEGEDLQPKLDSLKAVGEYTQPFRSNVGFYAVVRLDKTNGGKYASWEDFIESYRNTYKVTNQGNVKLIKIPKISLVSLFVQPAYAAGAADCLSQHRTIYQMKFVDVDTGSYISGASVKATTRRKATLCDRNAYDNHNVQGAYGNTVKYSAGTISNGWYDVTALGTSLGGYLPIDLDCNGPGWNISFIAPEGYQYQSTTYSGPKDGEAWVGQNGASYSVVVRFKSTKSYGAIKVSKQLASGSTGSIDELQGVKACYGNFASICSSEEKWTTWAKFVEVADSQAISGSKVPVSAGWKIVEIRVAVPGKATKSYTNVGFFDGFKQSNSISIVKNDTTNVTLLFKKDPPPAAATPIYGPWLQTKDGNVLSLGEIHSADRGVNGGRPTGLSPEIREADYVVMAYVVEQFCSLSKYNFGRTLDDTCTYDPGYAFNISPNQYNNPNDSTDSDPVVAGIVKSLQTPPSNSGDSCTNARPYIVLDAATMLQRFRGSDGNGSNIDFGATSSCPVIGTLPSGNNETFGASRTLSQGRATILVKPNNPSRTLTINGNIKFAYRPQYGSINEIPNLGLIVDGDVVIDNSVTELAVSIYATGKIKTCSDYPSTPVNCKNPLRVRGTLAAVKGFELGRNFFTSSGNAATIAANKDTSVDPAELIVGSGLVDAFPPPGFIDLFSNAATGLKYITTQGNPRF